MLVAVLSVFPLHGWRQLRLRWRRLARKSNRRCTQINADKRADWKRKSVSAKCIRCRARRSRGALPRLRGRGKQGDIVVTGPYCCLRTATLRWARSSALQNFAGTLSRSVDKRAQSAEGINVTMSRCSPRPRKRGSAPRIRPTRPAPTSASLIPTSKLPLH